MLQEKTISAKSAVAIFLSEFSLAPPIRLHSDRLGESQLCAWINNIFDGS